MKRILWFGIALIPSVAMLMMAMWRPETAPSIPECGLPRNAILRNTHSRKDWSGLSVPTAVEVAARFDGIGKLYGFQEWCKNIEGCGTPELIDKAIVEFLDRENPDVNVVNPDRQFTVRHLHGKDELFKELMDALCEKRVPCVTYGYSPTYRYGAKGPLLVANEGIVSNAMYKLGFRQPRPIPIAHMVNLCHLDSRWAAVWDSNFPNAGYEWLPTSQFFDVFADRESGKGWAIILDTPRPPDL